MTGSPTIPTAPSVSDVAILRQFARRGFELGWLPEGRSLVVSPAGKRWILLDGVLTPVADYELLPFNPLPADVADLNRHACNLRGNWFNALDSATNTDFTDAYTALTELLDVLTDPAGLRALAPADSADVPESLEHVTEFANRLLALAGEVKEFLPAVCDKESIECADAGDVSSLDAAHDWRMCDVFAGAITERI